MPRKTEDQIAQATIAYLATLPTKSANIANIRRNVPKFIRLDPEDLVASTTRIGEKLWEQQVRNIVCHRGVEDNAIHDGLILYLKAGELSLP